MSHAPHPSAPVVNALTIDVEEYFHPNALDATVSPATWSSLPPRVEPNTYRLLDLLDDYRVTATFFVLGWVAERWPRLVPEIARRGHEIASHGHAHRLVYRQSPQEFRADVARSKAVLEDQLGAPIAGFRAASYSIVASTLWALDVLIDEGFRYDSSIFPIRHDIYGIPGFSRFARRIERSGGAIVEIPASTVRLLGHNWPFGGGGYFRLFPYGLTCRALRHLNRREGQPAIVYLHPWELDTEQPRLAASATARFRQYTNIRRTGARLRQLIHDFRFAPIREALATFDLEPAGTVAAAPRRIATGASI